MFLLRLEMGPGECFEWITGISNRIELRLENWVWKLDGGETNGHVKSLESATADANVAHFTEGEEEG